MSMRPIIVGGGPAGMAAAIELVNHGQPCTLIDEASRLGGVVYRGPLRQGVTLDYLGKRYRDAMQALHAEFSKVSHAVEVKLNTRIVGGEAGQWLYALNEQEKVEKIDFEQLLLSAGCHERSVPFPGWTLPGVIMLGGLQLQIKSGVVKPLGRTTIVGTGPLLPLVACQLHRAGADVGLEVQEGLALLRAALARAGDLNDDDARRRLAETLAMFEDDAGHQRDEEVADFDLDDELVALLDEVFVNAVPAARQLLRLLEERGWTGWTKLERVRPAS